jgi:hypothetical protein
MAAVVAVDPLFGSKRATNVWTDLAFDSLPADT